MISQTCVSVEEWGAVSHKSTPEDPLRVLIDRSMARAEFNSSPVDMKLISRLHP